MRNYTPEARVVENGRTKQEEARRFPRTVAAVPNAHLPDVNAVYASYKNKNEFVRLAKRGTRCRDGDWQPWLGPCKGEGGAGRVFFLKVCAELREVAKRALMSTGDLPRNGTDVVVKIVPAERDASKRSAIREASFQRFLSSPAESCSEVPGATDMLCAASHVPKLHWFGMVKDGPSKKAMFLYVMSRVEGRHVGNALSARDYVRIERAVASLWWAGVAHGDLHKENVFLPPTGKASVIDFGLATLLPTAVRDRLRRALVEGVSEGVRSLGEAWAPARADAARHLNGVFKTREMTWFNSDWYALQRWFSKVTDRENVATERRKLWGFREPAPKKESRANKLRARRASLAGPSTVRESTPVAGRTIRNLSDSNTNSENESPARASAHRGSRVSAKIKRVFGPLHRGWHDLGAPARTAGTTRPNTAAGSRVAPPSPARPASPRPRRFTKVAATPRRPSDRLLNSMRLTTGLTKAVRSAARKRPARPPRDPAPAPARALDTGNRNTKGRSIMRGPRGGLYVVVDGKRRAPAGSRRRAPREPREREPAGNTGDRNTKGRPIMRGPRGGLYVVVDGKRRAPAGSRRR